MNLRAAVAVLLLPSVVLAQTPPPPAPEVLTYPPGDDRIEVVKKGEPAPYTGQLFDNDTALRWAVWLKQYKARYGLDLQMEKDRCAVVVAYQSKLVDIEREQGQKIAADLKERLKVSEQARIKVEDELRNPSFFKQPGTWFGIGLVTALVTVGVTAAVLDK